MSFTVQRTLRIFAMLFLWLPLPTELFAQSHSINPHVAFHSLESDDPGESYLRIFRIPVNITVRQWSDDRMGIRLRLAASLVTSDPLKFLDNFFDDLSVASIIPGAEFIFPVGNHHKLKPFMDVGLGTNNVTDKVNLLGDLGLRTEFIFPTHRLVFGLEPGLRLSANTGERITDNVAFNSLLTITSLYTIHGRILGSLPDAGIYVEAGYDNQALEYSSLTLSQSDLTTRYEAGITLGFSHGQPRIGPFAIPRLRMGYRFGDVTGFRFRLGGDWLTVLSEPL